MKKLFFVAVAFMTLLFTSCREETEIKVDPGQEMLEEETIQQDDSTNEVFIESSTPEADTSTAYHMRPDNLSTVDILITSPDFKNTYTVLANDTGQKVDAFKILNIKENSRQSFSLKGVPLFRNSPGDLKNYVV